MPVQRNSADGNHLDDDDLIPVRTIVLLCDEWKDDSVEGVAAINRSVAQSLTGHEGARVFCVTIKPLDRSAQEEAKVGDVQLFSLFDGSKQDLREQYRAFNGTPEPIWMRSVHKKIPEVSFIVGHFPGTAEAAVGLRDSVYPSSKVILFYHVIPEDVEWLADKLPYTVPSDNDLIRLAEKADAVYSVTNQVHSFFQAKFLNRAQKTIDHRLYLHQCSKQVFDVTPERGRDLPKNELRAFVLSRGSGMEEWQGLDIATCAMAKVATILKDRGGGPGVSLTIGNVDPAQKEAVRGALAPFTEGTDLRLDLKAYKSSKEQFIDMSKYHVCLVPSRAEPFGSVGLLPLGIGIPTLIAQNSYLATTVKRLTVDPSQCIVRTTKDVNAVRQDAGLWKDRVLELIDDKAAEKRSHQLKLATKRDDVTIQTHDNLVAYCLRGIKFKIEVTQMKFINQTDGREETATRNRLAGFLVSLLKQSWRLKRHPLIKLSDLQSLLPGTQLPFEDIIKNITDKIEDMDRRIVEVDETNTSLNVYCPGRKALRDLWAMNDRINKSLAELLFKNDRFSILMHFKLKDATTRIAIPGPEFLKHNEEMLRLSTNHKA